MKEKKLTTKTKGPRQGNSFLGEYVRFRADVTDVERPEILEEENTKILYEETRSMGNPFRYRGGGERKRSEGLKEMNIYFV